MRMMISFSSWKSSTIPVWLMLVLSLAVSCQATNPLEERATVGDDEGGFRKNIVTSKNVALPPKYLRVNTTGTPLLKKAGEMDDESKQLLDPEDPPHRLLLEEFQTISQQYVVKHSGKCMEVAGASMEQSAKIQQADCVPGATNQMFETITISTGGFMLKAVHSGMCLSMPGSSREENETLTQGKCVSSDNEILNWVGTSLMFKHSLRCLVVDQDSVANGAEIVQRNCRSGEVEGFSVANTIINTPSAAPISTANPAPAPLRVGITAQYANKNSGKCIGILGASTENGAFVRQMTCDSGAVQQVFETVNVDGGGFMLKSTNSGKCITVPGANLDGAVELIQSDCLELPNQVLNWVGDSLKFKHSGKCIHVYKGKHKDNMSIVQETCSDLSHEQFTLVSPVSYQPFVVLHSRKCMDIADESLQISAQIVQEDCVPGKASQQFEEALGTNGFMIKNKLSGKCVTVSGFAIGGSKLHGVKLDQDDCVNSQNQVFMRRDGELIVRHSNLCIGVEYASNDNGAPFIQTACNGFHDQIFSYLPYIVRHSNMCLDVAFNSVENHGIVVQADCVASGVSQKLRMIPGDGGFQLQFLHSGKCIGISGSSTANNAKVVQWDCVDGLQDQLMNWRGTSLVMKHSGLCLNVFLASQKSNSTVTQHDCTDGANEQFYSTKPTPIVTFKSIGVIATQVKVVDGGRYHMSLWDITTTKMNFLHRFPAYISQLSNGLVAIETSIVVHDTVIGTGIKKLTFHSNLPPDFGAQHGGSYDTVHVLAPHPQQKNAAYWAPRNWDGFQLTSIANRAIGSGDDEYAVLSQWTHAWLGIVNDYFYQWVNEVDTIDVESAVLLHDEETVPDEFQNSEQLLSKLLLGRLPKAEGGLCGLGREIFSRYGNMSDHLRATNY